MAFVYSCGKNILGQLGHGNGGIGQPCPIDTLAPHGPMVSLSVGYHHCMCLCNGGAVMGWGAAGEGRLGIGLDKESSSPTAIIIGGESVSIIDVACGTKFSLLLTSNGHVLFCGDGSLGLRGNGKDDDNEEYMTPVPVNSLSGKQIVAISAGHEFAAALSATGQVYMWGCNGEGQLANGEWDDNGTPTPVGGALSGQTIAQVSCGGSHALALDTNGRVFSWGSNSNGQLGLNCTSNKHTAEFVQFPQGTVIKQVAAGWTHSLALAADGTVFGWGSSTHGQVGDGEKARRLTPVPVSWAEPKDKHALKDAKKLGRDIAVFGSPSAPIIQISAGCFHSTAVSADGYVYTWGKNRDSQIGIGSNFEFDVVNPVMLAKLSPLFVKAAQCGSSSTVMLCTPREDLNSRMASQAPPAYDSAM